jgi:hypothetical protein
VSWSPTPCSLSAPSRAAPKLLWVRLARYAGTRAECLRLLSTVAADLGRSERHGTLWPVSLRMTPKWQRKLHIKSGVRVLTR